MHEGAAMTETTIIKATVRAWLLRFYMPNDLLGDPQQVISKLILYEPSGEDDVRQWQQMGYIYVGEADVTLRMIDQQADIANKVDALRAEQTRTLADARARVTSIEANIQKLLAIDYEATPPKGEPL